MLDGPVIVLRRVCNLHCMATLRTVSAAAAAAAAAAFE